MPKKKTQPPAPLLAGWLTVNEAAEIAGMLPDTLRRYLSRGTLPSQKVGGTLRLIRKADLRAFMKKPRRRGRKPGYSPKFEKALKSLSPREREVIKLRFGLLDGHTYTLEEVGAIFQITVERVRRVQSKALVKLGKSLGIDPQGDELQHLMAVVKTVKERRA